MHARVQELVDHLEILHGERSRILHQIARLNQDLEQVCGEIIGTARGLDRIVDDLADETGEPAELIKEQVLASL